MCWTIHFHDLPQVALHLGSAPLIVRWIVELLPVHWAWNSVSLDTWWDPSLINLDTHQHDQIKWLCTAILELEHALARDFVLSQYVHGRHVLCRSFGHIPSPSQAPTHRAGVISGQSSWERQIEVPLKLLNHLFEARRGYGAFDDVGQADATARRHVESDGTGPQLPVVSASRSWLDTAGNDLGCQGMASPETELRCHMFAPPGQLPQGSRDFDPTPDEDPLVQALRQKGILTTENAWNYLSWDQMSSTDEATTADTREGPGAHHPAFTVGKPRRPDPALHSAQTHESRSNPGRLSGDDTRASRSQSPKRSLDSAVRGSQHLERKRDMPVDLAALEADRPAKLPACYRHCPPCETLMRQLLRTKLYNTSNACYINAALMGQLWATLAFEGFDPELWGQ